MSLSLVILMISAVIQPSYSLKKGIKVSVHKTSEILEGRPVTDHRGLIVEFDI
jgi:hypothetical protein